MLVTPKMRFDPDVDRILTRIMDEALEVDEVEPGVFETSTYTFHHLIEEPCEPYHEFKIADKYLWAYGVCDNLQQVKNRYKKWLKDPDSFYCISMKPILRSKQPYQDGWRWDSKKWGDYIGDKNPQHEYLRDEEDIWKVYCFQIIQLKRKV